VLPPGLIAGSKLGFILENATLACTVPDFDHLRIPFRAVATDIQTGRAYVIAKGDLGRAIRASMAIPAIFTPVELDGHLLIDGGEAENLPVQTTRSLGADVCDRGQRRRIRQGARREADERRLDDRPLIDLPLQQNTQASAKLADIVITPDLEGYTSADFVRGTEMIPLGYKTAETMSEKLAAFSEPASVYEAGSGPRPVAAAAPFIDAIRDRPGPGVRPADDREPRPRPRPAARSTRRPSARPETHLRTRLLRDRQLRDRSGGKRNVLRITPTPKSWGPTFCKLGSPSARTSSWRPASASSR
jgi:NTE family protein